jgi:hypothetical protein
VSGTVPKNMKRYYMIIDRDQLEEILKEKSEDQKKKFLEERSEALKKIFSQWL